MSISKEQLIEERTKLQLNLML